MLEVEELCFIQATKALPPNTSALV